MNEGLETYEERRALAWHHKQHLDYLSEFTEKLTYWIENVHSDPTYQITYMEGENAPFTLSIDGEPKSYDERAMLYKALLNHHRRDNFTLNEIDYTEKFIKKLKYPGDDNEKRVGFRIEPFENLASNFQVKLSAEKTFDSKKKYIIDELAFITEKVDKGRWPKEIKELRDCFATRREYDFSFPNEDRPELKVCKLAEVWDIVRYEAYLKDELVNIEIIPSKYIRTITSTLALTDNKNKENYIKDSLEKCFEYTSKYNKVMEVLSERGFCEHSTHIWKDRSPAYKKTIVELIKYLHIRGFFGKTDMPKNSEIILIAKNTFGVDLSEDTVKHTKVGKYFDFIKPASTF